MGEQKKHLFYEREILRNREQDYIDKILAQYKNEPVSEELKKKIWDALQMEKHLGNINIPFRVVIRRDPSGKFPEFVEIILDTKV